MMYNDFDIIINFRKGFLIVLKYEIVRYSYLQVSGVKVFMVIFQQLHYE